MKLFDFQDKALKETQHHNRVAYYMDMGLGKTFVGAEKMKRMNTPVNLIVCQKSKVQDWIDHLVNEGYESHFQVIHDCTKWSKADWEAFKGEPSVMIINYELAFRREALLQLRGFTLMLDESSLIQNEKAKRSKFILKLQPDNVILLSGTPTSGKYENLWSQIQLLGWKISNALYNRQYVNWITVEVGGFPIRTVDPITPYRNIDRLKDKLRQNGAFFLKTEEVFTLPEQTMIPLYLPVTKEYRVFAKTGYVLLGDEELIGDTTLTKRLYLRMLCGQHSKAKLDAVKDLLESSRERFIIFYNFNSELEQLKALVAELERPLSQVNGPVKDLAAYESQSDSVTLIQYQAGAKGLNLQKASRIIYFTPTEKCEDWMQSQKRIHRIGQKNPCFYYLLQCKDSIEERIYSALQRGVDYTDKLFKEVDNGAITK